MRLFVETLEIVEGVETVKTVKIVEVVEVVNGRSHVSDLIVAILSHMRDGWSLSFA